VELKLQMDEMVDFSTLAGGGQSKALHLALLSHMVPILAYKVG